MRIVSTHFYRTGRALTLSLGVAACASVIGTLAWATPAMAAEPSSSATSDATIAGKPDLKASYDRAFQAMIQDVTNLDKTFAFAELAVQVGDYEGAIAAFERMLLIDPDLPQVKTELGALYMRLGSYEIAESYLNSALNAPDVPPAVQARIRTLLAEIARRLSPNRISGSLTLGARLQSNADAGPDSPLVEVGGSLATLSNQFTSKRDWNAYALGQVNDIYDFGTQSGTTLESTATFYGADQEVQKDVNVGFVELTSGPRFKLFPGLIANATIKPYIIGDILTLGHAQDYWAGGGGLDVTKLLLPGVRLDLTSELRNRTFHDSSLLPLNDLQTGVQSYNRVALEEQITSALTLSQALAYTNNNAKLKSDANREYSGILGLSYAYVPPVLGRAGDPWTSSLAVTRNLTNYAEPDPTIDPDITREDHDWELDVATTIPLTHSLSAVVSLGVFKRRSTLVNFRFTNRYGGVGLNWRF